MLQWRNQEELALNRRWTIRRPAPEEHFARFAFLPRPVAQLLYNRGFKDPKDADVFFARHVEDDDPFCLRGMEEAVRRIRHAIQHDEYIVVHGDFDADGVTSTVLMVTGLEALGARVRPYIPHRVDEGYGLNADAIKGMKANGVSLIVTVDCGIRSHEQIRLANELGIDVVVTDHHSLADDVLEACAVVNPHHPDCPYPHKVLSGVGLAWKTIQALSRAERKSPTGRARRPLDLGELLALVAIGTIADVVPLQGENRKLVWNGLDQLRHTRHVGLQALMEVAGITPEEVDEEKVAFYLGPRINAAGRLGDAMLAYNLLRETDPGNARQLASLLEQKNRERQMRTEQAMARAYAQIRDPEAPLLLVSDEHCPEGIVGLVAGRLTEEFYRPTVVISQGPEHSRGSCRSIPEFHITRALDQLRNLLEQHGGHAAAAGFTIRTERLRPFEEKLAALAHEELLGQGRRAPAPRVVGDAVLPLHEVSEALYQHLAKLQPFGEANEEPLWMCRNVWVQEARQVGGDGKHLKLMLTDGSRRRFSAIAFRQGERMPELSPVLDIAFRVRQSSWQGRNRLELHLHDFRPAVESITERVVIR